MSKKTSDGKETLVSSSEQGIKSPLVQRSAVVSGRPYGEYKQSLRYDFFHSCAYCTMTEAEAAGHRFTIDHYEPKSVRPDLENSYDNLMYCCGECNLRKHDISPPEAARQVGFRFFRIDQEIHQDHFQGDGIRVKGKTRTGEFTVDNVDLNRESLRRLRDMRSRVFGSSQAVAAGLSALKALKIDQLPPEYRSRATRLISAAEQTGAKLSEQLDNALLRGLAESELLTEDTTAPERLQERAVKLRELKAAYPGVWGSKRATARKR